MSDKVEKGIVPHKEDMSVEKLITTAINKKVDVGTMERLLAMRKDLKAEHAKEQFNRSMAAFQADCPTIKKTKEVKTSGGSVAYRYAPIESIIDQVKTLIKTHGFSYSFRQELKEDGVKVTCIVVHELGHSEEYSMEVPFGNKTNVMSQSQVAAAASTFAKRYAFSNAFGILTGDEDTDAAPMEDTGGTRRVERVIHTDDEEPITKSPAQKRNLIAGLLKRLGHEPKTRAEADEKVLTVSGLVMTEANYDDILERLEILVDEKYNG